MNKVYYPNPAYYQVGRMFFFSLIPLLALVPVVMGVRDIRAAGMLHISTIIVAVVIVLISIGMYQLGTRIAEATRLEVSPEGIAYHDLNQSIATSWDNTERISSPTAVLVLRSRAAMFEAILPSRDPYAGQHIPLYLFDYGPQTPLAADLHMYAPHLFASQALEE